VVDLGSGLGWLALSAGDHGLASICVDVSEFSCRRLHTQHSLPVIVGDAAALPVRPRSLGALMAFDVLEHVPDPRAALHQMATTVTPGCYVIISVPNTDGFGARTKRACGTWFGDRDETHVSLLTPSEWITAMTDAGLVVERSGTDFLWDVPYPIPIPARLQRYVALIVHRVVSTTRGMLRWTHGENLVVIGRVPRCPTAAGNARLGDLSPRSS
jgi:SAM-dependent methyltransferase